MKCEFVTSLSVEDTYVEWQKIARTTCNRIINEFNEWQINGHKLDEAERIARLIEYGKQTIDKDSIVIHEAITQMENFMERFHNEKEGAVTNLP